MRNFTPHFDALNALDGFSTTSDITLRFSGAIDPATLASNVRVVRVVIDNANKATVGVLGILQPNVDYSIGVSPDIDSGGATLLIQTVAAARGLDGCDQQWLPGPRHQWSHKRDRRGSDARCGISHRADGSDYRPTGGVSPPTCASITNVTLNGVCRLTYAHLAIGSQLPGPYVVDPTSVVASWSFSTVATRDTLAYLAATTAARPYSVFDTTLTTAFMGLPGFVELFAGTLNIDYRLAVPETRPRRAYWSSHGKRRDLHRRH